MLEQIGHNTKIERKMSKAMTPRKPWMVPCIYNDDRFREPTQNVTHHSSDPGGDEDDRDERDIDALLNRESRDVATNRTNDETPLNYGKGPHDDELDVSARDFKSGDEEPMNYARGEHDDEIDLDDEDELEKADQEEAIDPYAND